MDLCRDASVPGVYLVDLGDGSAARFDNNAFVGLVDAVEEPDAAVVATGTGWQVADGGASIPPWSDLDVDRYADIPGLPVDTLRVLGSTVASPFGEVHQLTTYVDGKPAERRLINRDEFDHLAPDCDILVRRRLSCVLLHRAQVVDLLGSLKGGAIDGDWSRLMLLAGIAEAPELLAVRDADASRDQLIALALFCEACAHEAHPVFA